MHVCLLGPGTRRRYAICVYAPRVPLPGYLCVLTNATPRLATWHDMVTYLRSWWRCVAMRRHTFCPLSLPLASYISGRAGGRWARLGYASWSPFTFVGVLFVFFGECSKFCDLAKQRRKIVGGVSEVGKDNFSLYFFWWCVVFLVFFFFCCDRATLDLSC